jgi:hypothetical protein
MNECDHVIGFNDKKDVFMCKSNIHEFSRNNLCNADRDIYFNFCAKCGEKLKEPE